jgi:hypothetical protein
MMGAMTVDEDTYLLDASAWQTTFTTDFAVLRLYWILAVKSKRYRTYICVEDTRDAP